MSDGRKRNGSFEMAVISLSAFIILKITQMNWQAGKLYISCTETSYGYETIPQKCFRLKMMKKRRTVGNGFEKWSKCQTFACYFCLFVWLSFLSIFNCRRVQHASHKRASKTFSHTKGTRHLLSGSPLSRSRPFFNVTNTFRIDASKRAPPFMSQWLEYIKKSRNDIASANLI